MGDKCRLSVLDGEQMRSALVGGTAHLKWQWEFSQQSAMGVLFGNSLLCLLQML